MASKGRTQRDARLYCGKGSLVLPSEAVILCGGLGKRLRPLTRTIPKPLAPINGRPFLAFLLDQLREQGIHRIVLLTGYLGEMIRDRFGDGSGYGVDISYSAGPDEWKTGRRLWEARTLLDERFLLLYSDNYVPIGLPKLTAVHEACAEPLTLLLQPKRKGNIRLAPNGSVALYDHSRTARGLDHVEIGYMLAERDSVLAELNDPDVSLSHVLEHLANRGHVAAMVSGDTYHSISDSMRWKLAERYLAIKRIILIDRDGTINERPPIGEYITMWDRFHWIQENVEAMELLAKKGFRFIVLSNQAGIARGMIHPRELERINQRMVAELGSRGIDVVDVYVCPHHWDEKCSCRKPEPGLFFNVSRDHLLRMDRTVYIGDDPRDCLAAFNAECLSILVGPERDKDPGGGAHPALTVLSMLDAVPWVMSRFEGWELQAC